MTCYTISNRAPSASSDNSPNYFEIFAFRFSTEDIIYNLNEKIKSISSFFKILMNKSNLYLYILLKCYTIDKIISVLADLILSKGLKSMAKKEQISKAELYRKERKERLAKEAKKNAKRNAKVARMKRVAVKTVAIIVAAVIVIVAATAIVNATGSTLLKMPVATVGGTKISTSEFQYYYRTSHANLVSQASQYDSYYGEGYYASVQGFDYTLLPSEQNFPNEMLEGQDIDETFANWDEYITYSTLNSIQYFYALAEEAEKSGMELTEDEITSITDQIEELRATATESGRTLNAYLRVSYGSGINENNLEKWMLRDALAQKYAEAKELEFIESYTADIVNEEFKANPEAYSYIDVRYYVFNVETEEVEDGAAESEVEAAQKAAEEKAKKEAEDFLSKIKSEKNFITAATALDEANAEDDTTTSSAEETTLLEKFMYDACLSNFGEDNADWAFSSQRKAGDKKIFEYGTDGDVTNYYAMYIVKPAYKDEAVASDIKAYTFTYDTDADDDSKAATKEKAQAIVDEWNSLSDSEKTAAEFEHLAHHVYPDEAETLVSTDYDDLAESTLTDEVYAWANDDARKAGDVAVVESSSGCYAVYYTAKNEDANWQITVKEALRDEDFNNYAEELIKNEEYVLNKTGAISTMGMKMYKIKLEKDLETYLYSLIQSMQSSTTSY